MKSNFYHKNSKYELEFYKNELIELNKTTKDFGEIQETMRQRHKDLNKLGLNFGRFPISKKFKEWGIEKKRFYTEKAIDLEMFLDFYDLKKFMATETGQVIFGSLLGDGTIHKSNHYFSITHTMRQKEYLEEKIKIIKIPFKKIIDTRGTHSFQAYTKKYIFFKYLRKQVYPNGKKFINFNMFNEINVLGLFIWVYDDGSIRHRGKNGSELQICAKGFTMSDLEKAKDILIEKFELDKITISRDKRLYFNKKSRIKLCELFIQNIPLKLLQSINNKYIAILEILKSSGLATDLQDNSGKGVVFG